MQDYYDKFDLMFFDAQKWAEEKRKKEIEDEKKCKKYMREIEDAGVCQNCDEKRKLRWVGNGEMYCCYSCFLYGLGCEADVQVPTHRVVDMKDYVSEDIWDELWEENK